MARTCSSFSRRVPEVVEEPGTAAEQHRHDVELELVQQPRCQVLPTDVTAAPERHVLAVGRLPCPFERGLDPVGDEVERGPSLHLHRITRVVGDDEHGVVVRRVLAPPARPPLVAPGTTADRPEHVSAHHAGADVLDRFLEYPRALVHLAALLAVGPAPAGQRNHPVVEPLTALAERVLLALVRPRDETVQRDRDVTPKLAHADSFHPVRACAPSQNGLFADRPQRQRWRLGAFASTGRPSRSKISSGPVTSYGPLASEVSRAGFGMCCELSEFTWVPSEDVMGFFCSDASERNNERCAIGSRQRVCAD